MVGAVKVFCMIPWTALSSAIYRILGANVAAVFSKNTEGSKAQNYWKGSKKENKKSFTSTKKTENFFLNYQLRIKTIKREPPFGLFVKDKFFGF